MNIRDADKDLKQCNKASKPPWKWDDGILKSVNGIVLHGSTVMGQPCLMVTRTDFDFITMAREALPYWIKRAQELESKLREASK